MRSFKILFAASAIIIISVCCKTIAVQPVAPVTGPALIIYKTKADYSKNVPVTLSVDRTRITSYPAIQDIYYNGKLAYPTPLAKGFLLDNRGIGPNSAFLKLTYQEYLKLSQTPGPDELYKMILDKDPITEMYNLGNRHRFKDEVAEINELIEKHRLHQFKKLK